MGFLSSYIREAAAAAPFIVIAALATAGLLKRLGRGRNVLVDAFSMAYVMGCLFVWFFLSAGGMTEWALVPGRTWYAAWRYGLFNAGDMYMQFLLNVVMLVPGGILLAFYDSRIMKIGALPALLLVEVIQGLTGRAFDADDLLAYALGLMIGYALQRLCRRRRGMRRRIRALGVMALIALVLAFPWGAESLKTYGYLYIDTPMPAEAALHTAIDAPGELPVYRLLREDPEEKINALSELTGITGTPEGIIHLSIFQNDGAMLRLYANGAWWAIWPAEQDDTSEKLAEEGLRSSARDVLEKLGYADSTLTEWAWQDEAYEVSADVSMQEGERWLMGTVAMKLDARGRLLKVCSEVLSYEEIDTVRTLSAECAASRHYSYPRSEDEKMKRFDVYELEVVYRRNNTAHLGQGEFLIPCWQLKGTVDGREWTEIISMIDYGL